MRMGTLWNGYNDTPHAAVNPSGFDEIHFGQRQHQVRPRRNVQLTIPS